MQRFLILLVATALLFLGGSACTRARTPWPDEGQLEPNASAWETASPAPTATPSGPFVPWFTPHVTSPPPTFTPTPKAVSSPTALPTPALPHVTPELPASGSRFYTVQPGETLFDIAEKLNVLLAELARVNHITDPTTITPGQQLVIPPN